ncbi:MAG: O-antigen ligase family protein [Candidatus Lernaella stagnicola]|nr:O-antigen ligase family protein [Candidatus Lernaella stagnicola]
MDRGVEAGSQALTRVPRQVFDVLVMMTGAVVLLYLFVNKNHYYAIGFVVVLFAVLFLMRRPVLLSYSLFALIPIYWVNLLGRSLRVITVLTLIGFAYYFVVVVVRRKIPRYNTVFLAFGLYLFTCAYSLLNSVMIVGASWPGMKYFLLALALFSVLVVSIEDRNQIKWLFVIFIAWGVLESILGAMQTFVSPKFYIARTWVSIIDAYSVGGVRRASGTFQIGPRYAMFLMGPLAIVVAGMLSGRVLKRRTWALLLVPFVVGIFVSLTRIAIALSFFYILLFHVFERRRQAVLASIAGLLVAVVMVGAITMAIPDDARRALAQRFSDKDDEVYMDRLFFLWNALGAFTEHPVLGIGVGTYELRSWEFMQKYPVPWRELSWDVASQWNMPETVPVHNEYGRMLAEQGIFSVPIFLFLIYVALRNLLYAFRHTRDELIRLFSSGTAMYLAALAIYWFFHEYFMEEPYISVTPFALSVILYNLVRKEQEKADAAPPANSVPGELAAHRP